jgi:Ca-activated chloride channel family protein
VGIGHGVQKPLLSRLASLKRGRFVFVESASAIGPTMAALFRQIEAPVAVDLRFEARGATLDQLHPTSLRDVFRDDELVMVAALKAKGDVTLRLHATVAGEKRVFEQRLSLSAKRPRPWVGRLWGKARVETLLEEIALFGESDARVQETLELALSYDLVTPYTAFLAIPDSELTDDTRAQLTSARQMKQALLAAHPEAAQVSRSFMPPGDPVLSVKAPRSSRQVTAYFPFGLVQDLSYEEDSERWVTRFLVPNDVADGVYRVPVLVVDAFGQAATTFVEYNIDSAEPEFDVVVRHLEGRLEVRVEAREPLREVRLAVLGGSGAVIDLTREKAGVFRTELGLAPGRHRLRIVATDRARNEGVREIDAEVAP